MVMSLSRNLVDESMVETEGTPDEWTLSAFCEVLSETVHKISITFDSLVTSPKSYDDEYDDHYFASTAGLEALR